MMQWVFGILAVLLFLHTLAVWIILYREYRDPSKALAWIMITLCIPVVGFLAYCYIARSYDRHHGRHRDLAEPSARKAKTSNEHQTAGIFNEDLNRMASAHVNYENVSDDKANYKRLFDYTKSVPLAPITTGNRTEIFTNAKQLYTSVLHSMKTARNHIHMEMYILRDDEIGREFQQLLIDKARQGLKIRLIYDGVGSYQLSKKYISELQEAGVQMYPFLQPRRALFRKRLNYRNHRKSIIIDGEIGYTGGANIGDEYLGKEDKFGHWRDTQIRIDGPTVEQLQRIFREDWWLVSGERLHVEEDDVLLDRKGSEVLQIVSGGPHQDRNLIQELYFAAIAAAQSRIYISTPYFIPDAGVMLALKQAALCGIDVRVIVPGISDTQIVKRATLSYLKPLLRAGVKFYEYERGFMHAKVMVIDEVLASIGTANLDMRSFFCNFETNAILYSPQGIHDVTQQFLVDLEHSQPLTEEQLTYSSLDRIKQTIAHLLSPLF